MELSSVFTMEMMGSMQICILPILYTLLSGLHVRCGYYRVRHIHIHIAVWLRSLKFAMRKFVPFSESAIVRFNCTENYKSFFCYILSKIVKLSLLNRFVDQFAYWLRNVFKKIQGI